MERRPQLLRRVPGYVDLVVAFVGGHCPCETGLLPVGEAFAAAPHDQPDPAQRVPGAPAMSEGLPLHPASDLVDCLPAELDDVEPVIPTSG